MSCFVSILKTFIDDGLRVVSIELHPCRSCIQYVAVRLLTLIWSAGMYVFQRKKLGQRESVGV